MLDAPRGRPAEGEGNGGDERANPMPVPIPEDQHDANASGQQHGERDAVSQLEPGRGRQQRSNEVGRGKNQALGIGDLR